MKFLCQIVLCAALSVVFGQGLQGAPNIRRIFTHSADSSGSGGYVSKNIGNEVIYQVVVDRFENGNHSNDCAVDGRFCSTNHSDWFKYWGGDLRGVINRISYIKSLGPTRLWLTPIFENQLVEVPRFKLGRNVLVGAYHGYWMRDWFRLSPFFTDHGNQDFGIIDELINRAAPDIKIYLDTVVNHSSPMDATQSSLNFLAQREPLGNSPDGVPRSPRGAIFRNGQYLTSYDEDETRLDRSGSYQPFFHHNPPIQNWDDQYQVEGWSLDGLTDIDQLNPQIQQYFDDAHNFWLDRFPGLAGYRMDSIKHVPLDYWRRFSSRILSPRPQVEAIGEYYGAGVGDEKSISFYRQTRFSMYDFEFHNTVHSVFLQNASFSEITRLWAHDGAYGDARELITFIDSHDVPRLRGEGASYQRMKQALALLMTGRGIPCLLYGIEQDLYVSGDQGDPLNRPMMASFSQDSDMFTWTKKLIALRKHNEALRYGTTSILHETDHILAFEREYQGKHVMVAMSKNPRQGTDDFRITGLRFPDGEYIDTLSGRAYHVRQGGVDVRLADGDVVVLSTP